MYSALAPLIGALITLMNGLNSRFSARAGVLVSVLVIHAVGLFAVSVFLAAKREKPRPGRLPAYYYLGGLVGVGTVFSSMYAFTVLGASLAVALSLLGQTLFSVVVDATGFMGRKRTPLTGRGAAGFALAAAGVAVMAGEWRGEVPAMLVALLSGALPGLSFVLNSELGLKKGIIRSTWINYVTGLAATLVVFAALRPPVAGALDAVKGAGPVLSLGGGLLGVVIVTTISFIFPRMTAFSATLLLFSGQALTGVLVDAASEGRFDARKLCGTLVLLAGLAVNKLFEKATARGGGGGPRSPRGEDKAARSEA
jgi:transporter family-2 protein